ncbi:helix-hairpin-helix domain-containing protein [Thermodesulfobacteriota bacterium]
MPLLEGNVHRITYFNEKNSYTIAQLRTGEGIVITIVGNMGRITPGETLRVEGSWEVHPKYGEQLRITSYEILPPATEEGIQSYLGSGLVKGIGPSLAENIVEQFASETLEVLENHPKRLLEVPGIGKARAAAIKEAWDSQRAERNVMIFLQGHGIGPGQGTRILREYGQEAIHILRENPYRLANDIHGIGFATADAIARKMGFPENATIRVEAGLLHTLRGFADEGHMYAPEDHLVAQAQALVGLDEDKVSGALARLAADSHVVAEPLPEAPEGPRAVYLRAFHMAETGLAHRLRAFLSVPSSQPRKSFPGYTANSPFTSLRNSSTFSAASCPADAP